MKAVILSAGCGSRLKAPIPKCLIRFSNGMCLLDYQLAALSSVLPIEQVFIVVGFKKELIMEAAPKCSFLYNHRFDRTNTAKSLALALERLDDEVLWMNGDVYVEPEVLRSVIDAPGNVILVNRSHVFDEEVCYISDATGHVVKLAKGISDAHGEALGVNKVCGQDVRALARLLAKVDDGDYFERAIEIGVERGMFSFRTIEVSKQFVKEMDFQTDFEAIENYLINRGEK
ncbi:MAG: phosphocholine cytidylyltransferase family protein [Bacillota bacterium]